MHACNKLDPASGGEKIQIQIQMRKILTCVQQTLKPAARRKKIQIQIQIRKIITRMQQTVKPAARGDKIDWEVEAAVHSQEQVGHLTTFWSWRCESQTKTLSSLGFQTHEVSVYRIKCLFINSATKMYSDGSFVHVKMIRIENEASSPPFISIEQKLTCLSVNNFLPRIDPNYNLSKPIEVSSDVQCLRGSNTLTFTICIFRNYQKIIFRYLICSQSLTRD